MTPEGRAIPTLHIASINCNSLNVSHLHNNLQKTKLYGITKIKADIILLCDIRLSNRSKISSASDISKMFLCNPYGQYEFLYNSTKNSRGVGIIYKKALDLQVFSTDRDANENILGMHCSINSFPMYIVSIYGPNRNCPTFFVDLSNFIRPFANIPIIIGGDWNATFSVEPVISNIDCLNMQSTPNIQHSRKIRDLCNEFNLTDPFRFLFPELREYTYCTRQANRQNKSRIDFFLCSQTILDRICDIKIDCAPPSRLFDHRATELFLGSDVRRKKVVENPSLFTTAL